MIHSCESKPLLRSLKAYFRVAATLRKHMSLGIRNLVEGKAAINSADPEKNLTTGPWRPVKSECGSPSAALDLDLPRHFWYARDELAAICQWTKNMYCFTCSLVLKRTLLVGSSSHFLIITLIFLIETRNPLRHDCSCLSVLPQPRVFAVPGQF